MIPQQNFENYPVFGDDATKIQPGAAKYAAGFQESDVLPAEWMNWAWNKNSKGITDLNAAAASMEAELGNVVTQAGLTPAANDNTQVMQAIKNFFTSNLATIYVTTAANVTPAAENVGTITALTDGLSVTVMLKNGYYGDGTNPMRFNLNNLGLKKIYAVKDGAPIIMPSHTIDRGDGNGSKPWYCQPYTTLKLIYDATLEEGSGAWVIEGNPVVLENNTGTNDYRIRANGNVDGGNIGDIKAVWSTAPSIGWLTCDGSTFDTTKYPGLYTKLGTNKVPDLRESVLVGIGKNTTKTISDHDVYTIGQFKDSQIEAHNHSITFGKEHNSGSYTPGFVMSAGGDIQYTSQNTDYRGSSGGTHGKQTGVLYVIKAL